MKRLLLITGLITSFALTQDIAGTYQLSGVNVQYFVFARPNLVNTDTYNISEEAALDGHHVAVAGDGVNSDFPYSSLLQANVVGLGTPITLMELPPGVLIGEFTQDHFGLAVLGASGVNLNVEMRDDGTGDIFEGSYYPTETLLEGTCKTFLQILPITDPLIYASDLNGGGTRPATNLLGLPTISEYAGQELGDFALSQSVVFPYMSLAGDYVPVAHAFFADLNEDGDITQAPLSSGGEILAHPDFGGYFPGVNKAWTAKGDLLNSTSFADGHPGNYYQANPPAQWYLEWNTFDGPASETGFGDILAPDDGWDEDGDGTDYDNIYGIDVLESTALSPAFGFNYPVAGDVREAITDAGLGAALVDANEDGEGDLVDASDFYVMKEGLEAWGGFLTFNALNMQGCATAEAVTQCMIDAAGTMTVEECTGSVTAACFGAWGANDSAGDFDYSCLADIPAAVGECAPGCVTECVMADENGNEVPDSMEACLFGGGSEADCGAAAQAACTPGCIDSCTASETIAVCGASFAAGGRLLLHLSPTCFPVYQTIEAMVEFQTVTPAECDGSGDVDLNGSLNVIDVIQLVQYILGNADLNEVQQCNANHNGEGDAGDISDVVSMVAEILGGKGTDAKLVEFTKENNSVVMSADGYVGAIDMTLSHSDDFNIEFSGALVHELSTEGNSTRVIIVNPHGNTLFTAEGDFEIVSAKAAGSDGYIDVATVKAYSISTSYPNPFNPSTSFSLELSSAADVSVNVYNIMGQLVDVLAEGNLSAQTHNFTWNAKGLSSGVYFIKTQVGADVHTQKVMLMK